MAGTEVGGWQLVVTAGGTRPNQSPTQWHRAESTPPTATLTTARARRATRWVQDGGGPDALWQVTEVGGWYLAATVGGTTPAYSPTLWHRADSTPPTATPTTARARRATRWVQDGGGPDALWQVTWMG